MSTLAVKALSVRFGTGRQTLVAVDRVDLEVPSGSVLGLVGESGSGKSTLARAIVDLVPSEGTIRLDGRDLGSLGWFERRTRRQRVQMVFQDPYASLNPRMTVGDALAEAVSARGRLTRRGRSGEVSRLLDLVTLDQRYARVLPRELSGGQRQRVAIARALAVKPDVLIADEVTSALDASVTGAILNLLRDLRDQLGLSILFISHNLAVVRYVSDAIGVMYLGRLVELASTEILVSAPQHPYTRALLEAVPRLDGAGPTASAALDEEAADPQAPPPGCHFHPRCPVGPLVDSSRSVCVGSDPWEGAGSRAHRAACHFAMPAGPVTSLTAAMPLTPAAPWSVAVGDSDSATGSRSA